jgi:hypothetical protein
VCECVFVRVCINRKKIKKGRQEKGGERGVTAEGGGEREEGEREAYGQPAAASRKALARARARLDDVREIRCDRVHISLRLHMYSQG